ncbi:hypothetical protein V496_06112 [Pseudogymnoascus sp. VKM F-4515 (FW-2607)]|nr:hypothetical protein V496_06112 [Pseudogymnoascus sp. VKM F-4515 (FW-2607)]KFY88493.1 hypothetical protein V498_06766 [Pseudogymnoascus sp. VKM F-4517 (FW-2822)]
MRALDVLLAAFSLLPAAQALSPAEWRSQSIYQVVTDRFAHANGSTTVHCDLTKQDYCGGSWKGIVNKLDYIQDMGFTAVWISPVVENILNKTADGAAYHGYWANDIYQLNAHFGTVDDLKNLSDELHARGMYLMVDVVTNHMAYAGAPENIDYSTLHPFNKESFYHPHCPIDYTSQSSTEICWAGSNAGTGFVSLPDLRTEDDDVQAEFDKWIGQLVANYTIDGLRIDSAGSVNQGFYPSFQAAAGGMHILAEVFSGDPPTLCSYLEFVSGAMNYPSYYWITSSFQGGPLSALVQGLKEMNASCTDTTLLGSFMENHDLPRFPFETTDVSLDMNAIAYTMLTDGIPVIYNGQEQGFGGGLPPLSREALWFSGYKTTGILYTHIKQLNQARSRAIAVDKDWVKERISVSQPDPQTLLMRKGKAGKQMVSLFTNRGAGGEEVMTLLSADTGFTANLDVIEVLNCIDAKTDGSGNLGVGIDNGEPLVFFPAANLKGSGICTKLTGPSTVVSTTRKAVPTRTSAGAGLGSEATATGTGSSDDSATGTEEGSPSVSNSAANSISASGPLRVFGILSRLLRF